MPSNKAKLEAIVLAVPEVTRRLAATHDIDAVRDAIQDVLLRLVERPKTMDRVRNGLAFLVTSTKNQLIDTGRRRQAEVRALERVHTDAPSPASRQGVASGLSRRRRISGHETRP